MNNIDDSEYGSLKKKRKVAVKNESLKGLNIEFSFD
jgi:hypothetical protein